MFINIILYTFGTSSPIRVNNVPCYNYDNALPHVYALLILDNTVFATTTTTIL